MPQKFALPTMSMGRAWVHQLPEKLDQIAANKFQGVEIFYEDLEYHAKAMNGGINDKNLVKAAAEIKTLCDERALEIIALQPFMFYEGLRDRDEHEKRIEKLHLWFELVKQLGIYTIQIPSNFLTEGITGDHATIIGDLREVCDLGLKQDPPVRFAYEGLCWGKYIDTWEPSWEIVKAVDRPNIGLCLDTFHIAGKEWADPSAENGKIANSDQVLKQSLERMKETLDISRVYYVQVADAERMRDPIKPGHAFWIDGQDSRMGWSRNARLFAFEDGGYLPVMEVLRTITDPDGLNFKGWISFELFSRTMADPDPSVPKEHALRAGASRGKIIEAMGW